MGNKVTLKVTAPDDAQAGETIAVIVNGKTVKTLTVGNDIPVQGSTNIEISLNNTDTHVDVKAVFTDQANNTATSATLSAGVDLVAPKVAINSITTSDTTPTITGTVDDETATVKVTINSNGLDTEITGTATVKADGAWSYIVPNASALSNGTYTVAATATDTTGNIGNANQNGTLTINTNLAIDATDDEVTAFFSPTEQVKTPALAHYESQETLELVNGQAEIAKLPFTLTQNDTIWLTVKQDNLVKLTDAFEVIVQNTVSGQEYTVASSSQQGGLLAGALSLEALGAVGDGADMAFSVKDLPTGSYTLSVRGDSSKLAEVLKTIDLSTLGTDTIKGLVNDTVLDLLHDTLVSGDYDARSLLEQLSLSTLLKVAKDTPGLGSLLTAVDSALNLLLDNPLVKPLLGDVYNSSISDIVAGKAGGLLGGIVAITLGSVLNALIDQGLLAHLDSLGEALYDNVVEPLVSDVLMDTVLSGTHLDDALDGVLGTVRAALDTLGLGDILPTVDDVVDLVADQVLSNPATLFPGLVADVYTMDGTGTYHVEGNVTEDSTGGTHADNLGNATVVSISHTNGNSVTETKQLDEDSSQDNASITIDGDFGKLTVHEDGSFSYDVTDPSDITEAQQEVFTYTITDSALSINNSDSATLTIHINPGQENITITTDSGAFLQGGSGDDVLTGDSSSNTAIFYNLINTDPTGGNGKDTWTNFTLGDASVENSGADKIDISNLLINYAGDGSTASLGAYLQVESANGDTTIKIDRDGSASTYQSTDLMVLKGVETTLKQLNQNHQIII